MLPKDVKSMLPKEVIQAIKGFTHGSKRCHKDDATKGFTNATKRILPKEAIQATKGFHKDDATEEFKHATKGCKKDAAKGSNLCYQWFQTSTTDCHVKYLYELPLSHLVSESKDWNGHIQ
ncbi:hypothetical protein CDAR_91851 [Caerostris darwini]|uniref:Uncharacterized protein n=1 Tax=Caerostris darwini TaxID=1538125 RepID=A0AAV4QN03_9ARAC|nr:hypothetical protein CDAR_91851 [Caerostris darwini]